VYARSENVITNGDEMPLIATVLLPNDTIISAELDPSAPLQVDLPAAQMLRPSLGKLQATVWIRSGGQNCKGLSYLSKSAMETCVLSGGHTTYQWLQSARTLLSEASPQDHIESSIHYLRIQTIFDKREKCRGERGWYPPYSDQTIDK
jgi:hypothetical protein